MNDLNNTKQQGEAFDRIHVTDTEVIHEVYQDVQPYLEHAANLRAIGYTGPSREMKFAGHLTESIINIYCQTRGVTYHEVMANPVHVKAMLNDSHLKKFRVWEGRV